MSDASSGKKSPAELKITDRLDALINRIKASPGEEAYTRLESVQRDVVYWEAEAKAAEVTGRREYFGLRKVWSWGLLTALSVTIVFQIFLGVSVGLKWLNFDGYRAFLYLIASENFAQIVGLCIFVVKFLFPPDKNEDDSSLPTLPRIRKPINPGKEILSQSEETDSTDQ